LVREEVPTPTREATAMIKTFFDAVNGSCPACGR